MFSLFFIDEAGEVGGVSVGGDLNYRVSQPVADGNAMEVDSLTRWSAGVALENVVAEGGDVLAGVALAGEEKRAGTDMTVLGQEELESGVEVGGDGGLVRGDVGEGGGDAEAGGDGVVDEKEGEEAVPGEGIGMESGGGGGDEERAELEEVAEHGGTAGATLKPDEKGCWGGGGGGGVLSFVEGVEKGGVGGGVDGEVAGFGWESFRWEWG